MRLLDRETEDPRGSGVFCCPLRPVELRGQRRANLVDVDEVLWLEDRFFGLQVDFQAMARVRGGRVAVDAPPADRRTLTLKSPANEPMRGHGSPPKSGSSFSNPRALRILYPVARTCGHRRCLRR